VQCQNGPSNGEPERAAAGGGAPLGVGGKLDADARNGSLGSLPERPARARFASLCIGCLLLAGMCGVVLMAGAVWQLGAIVDHFIELSHLAPVVPPRSARSLPVAAAPDTPESPSASLDRAPSREANEKRAPPSSLVSVDAAPGARRVTSATSFEASAEAPEKIVPLELGAVLEETEVPLTLGREPPPTHPRTSDCENVFVYIVTIAEGAPLRSAASLGAGKAGPARFRSPGDRIGDWTVVAISDDWSGLNPAVWLEKDGMVCKAELAGNPARVHTPLKPPPRPAARKRRRARR
jgi:hypothetical protein